MDAKILQSLPLATLQQRLTEALDAKHALATGKRTVDVGVGDQRIRYSEQNVEQLDGYIAALHRAIQAQQTGRPAYGPISLEYGGR